MTVFKLQYTVHGTCFFIMVNCDEEELVLLVDLCFQNVGLREKAKCSDRPYRQGFVVA